MKGRRHKNIVTGLTEQQEEFAFQYAMIGEAVKAYAAAYNVGKMQHGTIREEARRLLDNPLITLRVSHFRTIAESKLDVRIDRIAREFARVGFANAADLYDHTGELIPVHKLPEDVTRAIASVKVKQLTVGEGSIGQTVEVRFWPKGEALMALAKWKRMIVDRVEHVDPNDPSQLTTEEIEAQIRANDETLKVIDAARVRAAKYLVAPKSKAPAGGKKAKASAKG